MFPKIRGTYLGVAIIRIIVYWGLYWGPLILGNYHMGIMEEKIGTTIMGYVGLRVWGLRSPVGCTWKFDNVRPA